MSCKFIKIFCLLLITIILNLSLQAQAGKSAGGEKTGFIFGYKVKEGMNKLFEDGYKRHLNWHKDKNDKLVWYGWYVATGNRTGFFIDGSFGSPLKSFDERVDIAGDVADFEITTAPFVNALFRNILICKENLSTAIPLEEQKPSKLIQVITYNLNNGKHYIFENIFKEIIKKVDTQKVKFTLYVTIDGSESPQYVLMIPRNGYADYNLNYSIEKIIAENFDESKSSTLLKSISECVKNSYSETWAYRANLSYFPEN